MKKLLIILFLILITPIFSIAEEEKFLGYKKSETISLDDYLYDSSKQKRNLKINKQGDVTYKGKVIITSSGKTINDYSCGDSYLWMKIYFVANGSKPRKGCDEQDTINNGIYGLGCYIDTPEAAYKTQIERTIEEEFPKIKRKIDNEYTEAKKTYQKFLRDKNKKENIDEYIFIIEDYLRGIETSDVLLIYSLILITNNYQNIKINIPATDDAGILLEFIKPYFISNNINYSKLSELKIYKIDKINKINFLLNDKLYHFKYF